MQKDQTGSTIVGAPLGSGRPSRYLETGPTMAGASGGWECLIDSSSE